MVLLLGGRPRGFGHLIRRTTGQCVSSHAPDSTHTCELLCVSRRFLSRLPAELPLHTTAPRRYPVDHSIRSMHEKPCGPVNGKIPLPQASRPPDSRGGQVNATPVVEDHKMCRRSRIPMSIANAGDRYIHILRDVIRKGLILPSGPFST